MADPGGAPRLSQSRVRPLHFVMTARITGFGEGRKTMHYAFPQTILSVPSTTSLIVWSAPLSVQSVSLKKTKKRSYPPICFGGEDHESHYAHPRLAGARIGHWDCNGYFYTDATGCSVRWSELLTSRSATAASPQESTRAERKTRVITEATGDSIVGGRGVLQTYSLNR